MAKIKLRNVIDNTTMKSANGKCLKIRSQFLKLGIQCRKFMVDTNNIDMPLSTKAKTNIRNASLFILGVIVTIIFTKTSDKIAPNDPVIVKQYTDTLKIVHDYKLPENIDNDTVRKELEAKLKNLELLNNYDKQIKERVTTIQNSSSILPNLVLTQKLSGISHKGFTQASTSSYLSSDCPDLNSKYIDIKFNFINSAITKDIAYLRVNIYRFDNVNAIEAKTYILEDFYEIKSNDNFIRINNDLSPGKYEVVYGFMFKNDLNTEYPRFYLKKCIIIKQ